jgi:3-hydroxyisobutyrate dehydrogenase-like beta-hydroxyacid dehydrogenase
VRIGLLHPGEMGASVGGALVGRGHEVLWASEGRSPDTAQRAAERGLTDAGDVAGVLQASEILLSICPPHAALDVARTCAGFDGVFVDANAVAPQTAAAIAEIVQAGGTRHVDGGIIGPPPDKPASTRLYLSGDRAPAIADLFAGSPLDARVIDDSDPTAASALKMAYAAWAKGSIALLLGTRAMAERCGVGEALEEEWALSRPGLSEQLDFSTGQASKKGWRFVGEMEEIAATFGAAGLPTGFHDAAAEVYGRVPRGTDPGDVIGTLPQG